MKTVLAVTLAVACLAIAHSQDRGDVSAKCSQARLLTALQLAREYLPKGKEPVFISGGKIVTLPGWTGQSVSAADKLREEIRREEAEIERKKKLADALEEIDALLKECGVVQ